MTELKSLIRTVPDWPVRGVMFRDITTLLKDERGFRSCVDHFIERYRAAPIDTIVGIESRGFILGSAIAYGLGKGFVPIRKKGKLPAPSARVDYALEYGQDSVEIHLDAISEGQSVLLVDDLLATGGTAYAAIQLLESMKAKVYECAFVIDLPDLGGGDRLRDAGHAVYAQMEFEGE